MGYLPATEDLSLISVAEEGQTYNDVKLDTYTDSDHPFDWGSRKQQACAQSSTEEEANAANDALTRSTYPLSGILDGIWQKIVTWVLHIDNDPARVCIKNGSSNTLMYMAEHQRVAFSFLRDWSDAELHGGEANCR